MFIEGAFSFSKEIIQCFNNSVTYQKGYHENYITEVFLIVLWEEENVLRPWSPTYPTVQII